VDFPTTGFFIVFFVQNSFKKNKISESPYKNNQYFWYVKKDLKN